MCARAYTRKRKSEENRKELETLPTLRITMLNKHTHNNGIRTCVCAYVRSECTKYVCNCRYNLLYYTVCLPTKTPLLFAFQTERRVCLCGMTHTTTSWLLLAGFYLVSNVGDSFFFCFLWFRLTCYVILFELL